MEGTASPFQLKGTERVEEWKKRLERAGGEIRALDGLLERKRDAAKGRRTIAIVVALIAAVASGLAVHVALGVVVAIAGAIAAYALIKPPDPDFIGPERVNFVDGLLTELAVVAPKSRITLAAQLDARRALPKPSLPAGLGSATIEKESSEDWLSGSLAAIPGLRLSWKASERRKVSLVRKKVVRRKTKIKTKAKFAIAKRLAVRLDADRTLFAVKEIPPQPGRPEDGTVEVRAMPRGWSIRARLESSSKTVLATTDVAGELAALRDKGQGEYFGDRPSALVSLMKLCEGRLLQADAKGDGR